jgi:hypothetical protein
MEGRAVAVVSDLFFVARIRETARLAGSAVVFARTPDEVVAAVGTEPAGLVIVDLTAPGIDHNGVFAALEAGGSPRVPVLGYTTHALARQTRPLHGRCHRVVTKEALTRELPAILTQGLSAPVPALHEAP